MINLDKNSNSDSFITRRFLVFGKVQGVWYRASTKERAELCEVTGYAKNLENGSVEVLLQGKTAHVKNVAVWLEKGSKLSSVDRVLEVDASESFDYTDFKTF